MPKFADVTVGDGIPSLSKTPDRSQLVKYAAGSGVRRLILMAVAIAVG